MELEIPPPESETEELFMEKLSELDSVNSEEVRKAHEQGEKCNVKVETVEHIFRVVSEVTREEFDKEELFEKYDMGEEEVEALYTGNFHDLPDKSKFEVIEFLLSY